MTGNRTFIQSAGDLQQWVCWRYKEREESKSAKVPIDPETGNRASIANPDDWTNRLSAERYHINENTHGIGFVFTSDDSYVGVDLDDCVTDDGTLEPWARDIVETLDCYTEYSPSDTGIHCICQGTLPGGRARNGQVEMYEQDRYFTVTADTLEGNIPDHAPSRTDELETVYEDYVETNENSDQSRTATAITTGGGRGGNSLSDEELIAKATSAKKSNEFLRLWRGNTSGNKSHSEADMELCCRLAFWTAGDPEQIDRLFRRSGLYREKWDEQRGDQTYGELTIRNAINEVDNFYVD